MRGRAHGVQLTPTGERVLIRAKALLEQAGDLAAEASGAEGVLTGPLAIGCYSSLGPTLLPRLLYEFNQLHPQVTVDFVDRHCGFPLSTLGGVPSWTAAWYSRVGMACLRADRVAAATHSDSLGRGPRNAMTGSHPQPRLRLLRSIE